MRHFGTTRLIDLVVAPWVYPSAWLLRNIRKFGVQNFPHSRRALARVGVFPIRDHYTEPQFDLHHDREWGRARRLPGIDWNVPEQLALLEQFTYAKELADVPRTKRGPLEFFIENGTFGPGDADYLYQIIRLKKPRKIIEIGCGHSTLMAIKAAKTNLLENPAHRCEHVCIEPYENPWLEDTGVSVIRRKVEELDTSLFTELDENDLLFIDSSHVIRPEGDVLFEYLEILPLLKRGVIVHVHDIFTPRNYPAQWLVDWVRLWNEQYLLEAFLSHNRSFKIIGALNYLHQRHHEPFAKVTPFTTPGFEPGSFYIQKVD